MGNQFETGSVNLCGDVKDPMSLSEIMGLVGGLDDLEGQSSLNVNRIVCGMLEIPTLPPSELYKETCPGLAQFGDPPNIQLLNVSFGCNEGILNLLQNQPTMQDIYDNLGTAILSFYPQACQALGCRRKILLFLTQKTF